RAARRSRFGARVDSRRESRADRERSAAAALRSVPRRLAPPRQHARARTRALHLEGDRDRAQRNHRGSLERRRRHVLRDRIAKTRRNVVILIVDDEPLGCDTVREVLEDEGYEVRVARDGLEAMHWLTNELPTLLILDLLMPGMNGNELYEEMQKSPKLAKIPVLVMTSDPTRAPRGVPPLAKPFNLDKLLSLVAFSCGRI